MDITKGRFEAFFRESYSRGYYFALQFVDDEEVCRDILSECFMQMWANRGNIDEAKLSAYFFTSVRNKCLTHIRKNAPLSKTDSSKELALVADTEEAWKVKETRIVAIEAEIEKLPERSRFVLEQCYYNHKSYKEVADMMGISTSGVKKHIVTSMAHLRAHFNKDKLK
jgi:RNA polymerase sigma-70 factor (ECF subfamily)